MSLPLLARHLDTLNDILASWREYQSLPSPEWRKDFFSIDTGGFVAKHQFKTRDDLSIAGIAAEVRACFELASIGKHILRLPENIPELIDDITIDGRPYREHLKFKPGETNPRGYPDAYFDGQTWDFKSPEFNNNIDSLRQLIKDGRKADSIIFIVKKEGDIRMVEEALFREIGRRRKDNSWHELPNVYYLLNGELICLWKK